MAGGNHNTNQHPGRNGNAKDPKRSGSDTSTNSTIPTFPTGRAKFPMKSKTQVKMDDSNYNGELAEELTEETVLNGGKVWLKGKSKAFPIYLATDKRKITAGGVNLHQYRLDKKAVLRAEEVAKSKGQKKAHGSKRK